MSHDPKHKKNLMQSGIFARALGLAKGKGMSRGMTSHAKSSSPVREEQRQVVERHKEHR